MRALRLYFIIEAFVLSIQTRANNRHIEPLVVKGNLASIRDHPHCVYLFMDCETTWMCGASVLSEKLLITAAHCLDTCENDGRIDAFAGHEDRDKVNVKRRVQKMLVHEDFNDRNNHNDIGLLYLKVGLPLGDNIKRVIIDKRNNLGVHGIIAGWGLTNDRPRTLTKVLMYTSQEVRPVYICRRLGHLPTGTMCAGSINKHDPRPSLGDSGSALVTSDHRQIGILSSRFPSHPALLVYTNISYFYDWINEKSNYLLCHV